jgi:ABC-2 type transport system permease protein
MNTSANAMPEPFEPRAAAPAVLKATRPFYWSVRRELWENRSIYIAPLAMGGLTVLGFLISLAHRHRAEALDAEKKLAFARPYDLASLVIMAAAFVVAIFYCLEALHGERRDRSILFWKSLPVSDLTTVLAKATIPVVVLPLIAFATMVVTQLIMLVIDVGARAASGGSVAELWAQVPLLRMWGTVLFHLLAVHGLYYAPFYGWLLLISGWARRAGFLWAGLPVLAIAMVEKIAFNTTHFLGLLGSRLGGGEEAATSTAPGSGMMHMPMGNTVAGFLSSPGLWIGLLVAAGFLAAAVRVRRSRGPI